MWDLGAFTLQVEAHGARGAQSAARLLLAGRAPPVPHRRKRSLLRPSNYYKYLISLRGKTSHSFSRNLRLLSASMEAILGLKRILLDFSFSEILNHSWGLLSAASLDRTTNPKPTSATMVFD